MDSDNHTESEFNITVDSKAATANNIPRKSRTLEMSILCNAFTSVNGVFLLIFYAKAIVV